MTIISSQNFARTVFQKNNFTVNFHPSVHPKRAVNWCSPKRPANGCVKIFWKNRFSLFRNCSSERFVIEALANLSVDWFALNLARNHRITFAFYSNRIEPNTRNTDETLIKRSINSFGNVICSRWTRHAKVADKTAPLSAFNRARKDSFARK